MELNEALAFIHATDWKGSRLGLERMRELMHRLGNPQDSLKFIHVAGTNGKGSTSTMLASILTAAASFTASAARQSAASGMSEPLMRNRSFTRTRCGEV